MHYLSGLDVHKQSITYCVKTADRAVADRGTLGRRGLPLEDWAATLPQPWQGVMEATAFSGWIHDTLASPRRRSGRGAPGGSRRDHQSKKKSDKIDAEKMTDLLRVDMLRRVWLPA
ncbi:MAG: hypothetical protein R2748_06105 [Bryobacterales bacterium]